MKSKNWYKKIQVGDYLLHAEEDSYPSCDDFTWYSRKTTLSDFRTWEECEWSEIEFNKFLAPIALTPNVLKKIGFHNIDENNEIFKYSDSSIYITVNLRERTRVFVGSELVVNTALGYLHELQHAIEFAGYNFDEIFNEKILWLED